MKRDKSGRNLESSIAPYKPQLLQRVAALVQERKQKSITHTIRRNLDVCPSRHAGSKPTAYTTDPYTRLSTSASLKGKENEREQRRTLHVPYPTLYDLISMLIIVLLIALASLCANAWVSTPSALQSKNKHQVIHNRKYETYILKGKESDDVDSKDEVDTLGQPKWVKIHSNPTPSRQMNFP